MDRLGKFIMQTAGEPWQLAWSDCCPWLLRWVEAAYAGRTLEVPDYGTDREALKLIRQSGGLEHLISGYCERLGLGVTDAPCRGDIAVIRHSEALGGMTTAIYLGNDKWLARQKQGELALNVTMVRAEIVLAWRVSVSVIRQLF